LGQEALPAAVGYLKTGFGLPHENIALPIAKTSTTNTAIENFDAYQGVE
jgi:hypothetical protein